MTPEERKRLELELEYLNLEKEKAQAQARQPASPFLQRAAGMLPAGTQPVFPTGAMATPPREPAAWEAGAREYVANMPERERGGIESGGDAFLFNVGNVLTAGGMQRAGNQVVPGKNLGDAAVTEGESYYPTASVLGRGVGYAAPAGQGGRVANMATQDLITATGVRALAPKALSEGTDAFARSARYLGRGATLAPVGALQVGAYEGLVEQPVRDFMAGEESTIGGRVRAGANALANPLNYGVLPAASLVGRLGKSVVTGVATPGDVQRAVTAGSRGAVPLSEGQLAADAAQILDTQAMNAIDPRGFKLVERILRQSGLSDSDIPAVNAKVRELIEAAPDAVASRLTVGQVYAKALYDLDKTQAGENILKVLRERRNVTDVGDRSPSIVGKEVRDLRGSQIDFITQSAESNLGSGKRIDIKNAVAETKKQIGAEYERVLGEADPTRPEARGIAMIVMGDASAPGILKRRAENAGFESVEAYVANRPDEAGHWLRSSLAKAARGASGREKIELETTVGQLDELLDTNAGYAQARQQYGTEIGVDEARDIGSNFIAAARNQGNLDLLLEQIAALPPRQRDVALLAIRDNLLSPVRGSGEDAPARISQLVSVGTLEGLEQLGPAGKGLADDIRAIRDENQFLGQIDSGNPLRQSATFSNADAVANAPDLYSGAVARTLNDRGGSSLAADIAVSAIAPGMPIAPFTMAKIARGGLQAIFAPGRKSKEAMTQFLMSRPRNALPDGTPPAGAPPPQVPPGSAPAPNALAPRTVGRARNNESGSVRTDVATTLAGGAAGYQAGEGLDLNNDGKINWEDRVAGVIYGVAGKYAAKPVVKSVVNALDPTYIPKSKPLPPEPPPMSAPERRYDDLRRLAEAEARKSGQTLTPEQLKQRVDDDYRAFYKKDPPGMEQSPEMLAQGWQRSLRDAVDTLEKEAGPGNYTAYDVEREAITSFTDYYGSVRLPKNTLADADKLVPGTVDPSDLTPPSDIKPQGPGALRGDLGNALAGAGLGGIAPADSNEERLRNMAIGAGVGGASRTVGRLAGAQGDDVARTAGVGGPKTPARIDQATNLPLNKDGTVTIYHATKTKEAADEIRRTGVLRSAAEPDVYVSTAKSGTGYGDHVVAIDVDPKKLILDDEFPDGRMDFRINTGPSRQAKVRVSDAPNDPASPILTAGAGGGRKPPKPDSPEAIKAAVRDMAKPAKAPTRLEQMVEAGKDASVPPINTLPGGEMSAANQAERMAARGLSPVEIYDQTGVAMVSYNGGNVPVVSPDMGPEEVTRTFYAWLQAPPAERPEWVQHVLLMSPNKKSLKLTDRQRIAAPPQANALAEQPLPPGRFPGGAAALGAGAGILTGVPAGVVGGTLMAREQERKRTVGRPRNSKQ